MRQGLGQVKRRGARWTFAAIVLTGALGGCDRAEAPRLSVGGAHIVLPVVPGRPATLYFVIDAASVKSAQQIEGIVVEGAKRAEMHESITVGGMASMRPLAYVPIIEGLTRFCPGGNHVMLFGLDERLEAGLQTRVHIRLDDGHHLDPDAMVVPFGTRVAAEKPFGCGDDV